MPFSNRLYLYALSEHKDRNLKSRSALDKGEDMDNDSKDYILLQKGWMYRSAGGEDLITSNGEISYTIAAHNRHSGSIKINEEMHFMELLAILHEFGLI